MYKKHILSLKRYQTSENRDVLNGIILDRNERADHYDTKEFNSVLNKIPKFSLNATPDISLLYKKIAKLHNLKVGTVSFRRNRGVNQKVAVAVCPRFHAV